MGWAGSEVSCFPFPSTNTQPHQLTHMHSRAHTTHARAHTITLHLPSLHTYQAYSHFCVSHSHTILSLVLPRGHAHSRKLVVVVLWCVCWLARRQATVLQKPSVVVPSARTDISFLSLFTSFFSRLAFVVASYTPHPKSDLFHGHCTFLSLWKTTHFNDKSS